MLRLKDVKVLARPGYFGKNRPKVIAKYNEQFGSWQECWQVLDWVLNFEEAVTLYDDAYYEYIRKLPGEKFDEIIRYAECYDHDPSNILTGVRHDPLAVPRHIQDVSVRRALVRMNFYFNKFRGSNVQYDESELLHIRGEGTNGNWLMPGNIPFHKDWLILPTEQVEKFPKWADPKSVEGFWQANKVIVEA